MTVSVSTCKRYVSKAVMQSTILAIYAEYSDLCEGAIRGGDAERFSKPETWLERLD